MSDSDRLHRVLAYRNARHRAWYAYGIPIELPTWRPYTFSDGRGRTWAGWQIVIGCSACDCDAEDKAGVDYLRDADRAVRLEEQVLARVVEGCDHLAPLLGEDPPEVVELTRLELLAGD